MRKFFVLFLSITLFACSNNKPAPTITAPTEIVIPTATLVVNEPERTQVEYEISDDFLQNPERGFSSEADIEDTDLGEYYEDGVTLVYTTIRLDDYRDGDIPEEFLQQIDAYFSAVRGSGVKSIVRFAYNDGPFPNSEPDASLEKILRHIEQLQPVLQNNNDVIVWMEAGFIGAWGEWHASTNELDESSEAKLQILNSLLNALPDDRSVLLRYPVDMMTFFPTPLSVDTAFTGNDQSRVGFHNDCFLASSDDENTYGRDGVFTIEQEVEYLKQTTQFVPVGGESCAPNPPRSDCPSALQELALFHFTELGDGWHPDVLGSWEAQGCYEEIENRLGYRFSLVDSTVNERVSPGGILHLKVKLENTGFSSPINYRPVYLVLDGVETFEVLLPVDARLWLPGSNEFEIKVRLPAHIASGEYELSLWLPDPSKTLQDNPRYSILFANYGVWDDVTAYNRLRTIIVDTNAGGNIDLSADELMVIE